ncbi:MAG: phosphoribosylamine--glycine ligase [Elusimicrobiota bacterium]|jgi:phosphoribosylamine--glycine ligase|nr:phosphoribosylamine--glycine ligase [Elusimicrobiota bacterium]
MKILVIGTAGREHALAWKLAQSPKATLVYTSVMAAASLEQGGKIKFNPADISTNDKVIAFCQAEAIDLVVIGPEAPLAAGLADALRQVGIKVFGAVKAGAMLESSKEYSKKFMDKYFIPTAAYKSFTDADEALKYIETLTPPIVIKADGLAAGKGVNICLSKENAAKTINDFMVEGVFGGSGSKVVVEEFLEGREASIIAFIDGDTYKTMPVSRDHKRLLDGDLGPNTGGMGVYSPVLDITEEDIDFIREHVFDKAIKGLKAEGVDYCGILYAGIMKGPKGINVLEFNARSGDPETQAILPLLEQDLLELILACVNKNLKDFALSAINKTSVCITLAGRDYPVSGSKGLEITGLDKVQDVLVFHAGTKLENGKTYTNGGRVLSVVALGENLADARQKAYAEIAKINFDGMQYRRDIGEE